MENIKGIFVSIVAPFDNHIANGGEKLLGNASSIKRRPDGKVYIAGQMQRHVFFSALNKLNNAAKKEAEQKKENQGNVEGTPIGTFVSNADGISEDLLHDLRADLGGFMHTEEGTVSPRRTGALSVTMAVAKDESKVKNDLLNRAAIKPGTTPTLATKEFSQHDDMIMNFYLDMNTLSVTENPKYPGGYNVNVEYNGHEITKEERKRRAKLFLQSTALMNDYANQSRNAVCGEPRQVIIVFDTIASRKASRYWEASDIERKNITDELNARRANYWIGDDTTTESVFKAYQNAYKELDSSTLYDPVTNRDGNEDSNSETTSD